MQDKSTNNEVKATYQNRRDSQGKVAKYKLPSSLANKLNHHGIAKKPPITLTQQGRAEYRSVVRKTELDTDYVSDDEVYDYTAQKP